MQEITVQEPVLNEKNEQLIGEDKKPVFKPKKIEVPKTWKNKEIELTFPTLEDAVRFRWGDDYETGVPENLKAALREDRIVCTVGLESGIVPKGYVPITESVIEEKADETMAQKFADAENKSRKKDMFERLAWIGTGMAIAFALSLFGVF